MLRKTRHSVRGRAVHNLEYFFFFSFLLSSRPQTLQYSRLRFGRNRLPAHGFLLALNSSTLLYMSFPSGTCEGDFIHVCYHCPRSSIYRALVFSYFHVNNFNNTPHNLLNSSCPSIITQLIHLFSPSGFSI